MNELDYSYVYILAWIWILIIACCIGRGLYILGCIHTNRLEFTFSNVQPLRTILCVGSGGHTSEILKLVSQMNLRIYSPRLYIRADSDTTSECKIQKWEKDRADYEICTIPRSRHVNQSYGTSIYSTLYATLVTIPIIYKFKPNIIFCNGPGTCIPICVVAFIMRCLFILDCRIIFVESVCRVRTLSLTGKILQYFADMFVVQWPELHKTCFHSQYYGRLT